MSFCFAVFVVDNLDLMRGMMPYSGFDEESMMLLLFVKLTMLSFRSLDRLQDKHSKDVEQRHFLLPMTFSAW
jgi:hypothetical protein